MKKMRWKQWMNGKLVMIPVIIILGLLLPLSVEAKKTRTVRVAFFPMKGFHNYSEEEGYGGMEDAYLEELCHYTGWKIEYVNCDSWNDALARLEAKEVDLVGF